MNSIIEVDELTSVHIEVIHNLWNREYPVSIKHKFLSDTETYLSSLKSARHWFVKNGAEIVGWLAVFFRDDQVWFAMIVNSKHHKKGIGRSLLTFAQGHYNELHGWVIDHNNYKKSNGELYSSPLQFYAKNGFELTSKRLDIPKLKAAHIVWSKGEF